MLRSSICIYAYTLVKGTVTVENTSAAEATVNSFDEKVIFKNGSQFINCISRITNTQVY